MILAPLVAPILATTPAAVFAPVPGRAYFYRIAQVRTVAGETHRYVLTRRLVFRRMADGGWTADLTFVSAEGDPDAESAAFGRISAALGPRPIRFRLDAAGAVAGIDDADAVWALIVQAVAHGDPKAPGRYAAAARTLTGFPSALRQDFLSSMLAPTLGAADLTRPAGGRPINVPAAAPGAPSLRLPGREIVSRARDGMVDVSFDATGALPGKRPGTIALGERRRVDPATGLVIERREERRIVIGLQRLTITTITTITGSGN